MFSATVDLPAWLFAIATVFGLAGTLGSAWAVARQKAITASLDTITTANEELRRANADLHQQLAHERERRAELEGKVSIFVDEFADRIVLAVMETWRRTHPPTTTTEGDRA